MVLCFPEAQSSSTACLMLVGLSRLCKPDPFSLINKYNPRASWHPAAGEIIRKLTCAQLSHGGSSARGLGCFQGLVFSLHLVGISSEIQCSVLITSGQSRQLRYSKAKHF